MPSIWRTKAEMRRLLALAGRSGAIQSSKGEFEWAIAGHCVSPRIVQFDTLSKCVLMAVKCRRCYVCLAERRAIWATRALYEYTHSAGRTWLATYTIAPEEFVKFVLAAKLLNDNPEIHKRLVLWEQRSEMQRYLLVHKQISLEITKMFKRMKKHKIAFRFMMVLEAHKSGKPHYHALIHEVGKPVSWRELKKTWDYGFSGFKLVNDHEAAVYVCKYLGKDDRARIRASQNYGYSAATHPKGKKEQGTKKC